MGVHDYICFVQQNDQCITPLQLKEDDEVEDDSEAEYEEEEMTGSGEAIIALVPAGINVHSLHLSEFKQFPTITSEYGWDGWEFKAIPGYFQWLCDHGDEGAVWESKSHPATQLVNFESNTYKVFVQQSISPERVPLSFYRLLLQARKIPDPGQVSKKFLHTLISRPISRPEKTLEPYLSTFVANGGGDLLPLIAQYARPAKLEPRNYEDLLWIRKWHLALTEEDRKNCIHDVKACSVQVLQELHTYWGADKDLLPRNAYLYADSDEHVVHELIQHYGLEVKSEEFETIIQVAQPSVLQYIRTQCHYDDRKVLAPLLVSHIKFEHISQARELLLFPCLKSNPLRDWTHKDTVSLCRNGRTASIALLQELGIPPAHFRLNDNECLKAAGRGDHREVIQLLEKMGK